MAATNPHHPTPTGTSASHLRIRARGTNVDLLLNVPIGETKVLGGAHGNADFRIPDGQISRRHAEILGLPGGLIQIQRMRESLNRVYLLGPDLQYYDQEYNPFQVGQGNTFAIGTTTFTVEPVDQPPSQADPRPSMSVSISAQELRQELLTSPDNRLQAALVLPQRIAQAPSEEAMIREALRVLQANLRAVELTAVVSLEEGQVHRVQQMGRPDIHLSQRLLQEAQQSGEAVLYHWHGNDTSTTSSLVQQPTWGACVPLSYGGYYLYVGGESASLLRGETEWRPVLRFLEFVSSLLGSLLVSRRQRMQQERLGGFLPRRIRQIFEGLTEEQLRDVLRPQLCDMTVMFCDLVGFSRLAQEHAENTGPFWETVQRALTVMTECIHETEGVVIDFQGDSVLAVWGWPLGGTRARQESSQGSQRARQAGRAALNILQRFPEVQRHFDNLFRHQNTTHPVTVGCGVALTSGPALVGFMGNQELGGIDAFGHTINRASRIQSLTRRFNTRILIDELTANLLAVNPPDWCRVDPLLSVYLAGMQNDVERIAQLALHPAPNGIDQGQPTEEERELFRLGHWRELRRHLAGPRPLSGYRQFLDNFLRELNDTPPADWDGIFAQRKEG